MRDWFQMILDQILKMNMKKMASVNKARAEVGLRVNRVLFVEGLSGSQHTQKPLRNFFILERAP